MFSVSCEWIYGQTWHDADQKRKELQQQNDYAGAIQYGEQALKAASKNPGKTDTVYPYLLNAMLELNYFLGKYDKALGYGNKELQWRKKYSSKTETAYMGCLIDLAYVYVKLKKNLEAEALIEECIDIAQVFDEKSNDRAGAYHRAGVVYRLTGNFEKAEHFMLAAVELRAELFGEEHYDYANSCNSLAVLYITTGDAQKLLQAETLLLRAIGVFEKHGSGYRQNYVTAVKNIAFLYSNSDLKYTRSKLASIWELFYEAKGIGIASAKNKLADAYMSISDYDFKPYSEQLLHEAIHITDSLEGQINQVYVESCYLMAKLYRLHNMMSESFEWCTRAIGVIENNAIVRPAVTSDLYELAAELYFERNNFAMAGSYYLRSEGHYVSFKPDDCNSLLQLCQQLSSHYKQQPYKTARYFYDLLIAGLYLHDAHYYYTATGSRISAYLDANKYLRKSFSTVRYLMQQQKHYTEFNKPDEIVETYLTLIQASFDSVASLHQQTENTSSLAECYVSQSEFYKQIDSLSLAYSTLYKAIDEYSKIQDHLRLSDLYFYLFNINETDNIEEMQMKYLQLCEHHIDSAINSYYDTDGYYTRLASVYSNSGYLAEAVRISEKLGIRLFDELWAYHFIDKCLGFDYENENESMTVLADECLQDMYNNKAQQSDSAAFYNLLGLTLINEGYEGKGYELLRKSMQLYSDIDDVVGKGVIISFILENSNSRSIGRSEYRDWIKSFNDMYNNKFDEALLYHNDGNSYEAIGTFRELVSMCSRVGMYNHIPRLYIELAGVFAEMGETEIAENCLDLAISIAEEDDWRGGSIADAYLAKAAMYYDARLFDEAFAMAEEAEYAAAYSRNVDARLGALYLQADISNIHYYGAENQAIYYTELWIKQAKRFRAKEQLFDAYLYAALLYQEMSDFKTSASTIAKAKRMKLKNDDTYRLLSLLYVEARQYYHMGKPDMAIAELNRILQYENECKTFYFESVYDLYGFVLKYQGKLNEAMYWFNRSLELCRNDSKRDLNSNTYNHIAWIFARMGEIDKAFDYHEKALHLQKQRNEYESQAFSLLNIGSIYLDQGDPAKAMELYNNALKIGFSYDLYDAMINAFQSIGLLYMKEKNYPKALDNFYSSLDLLADIDDKIALAWSNRYAGDACAAMHRYDEALDYYSESLDLAKKSGVFYGRFDSNLGMADCYLKMGLTDKAKQYAGLAYDDAKKMNDPEAIYSCSSVLKKLMVYNNNLEAADSLLTDMMKHENKLIMTNFATLPEAGQELFLQSIAENIHDNYSYILYRSKQNKALAGIAFNSVLQHKGLMLKSSTAMRAAILQSGDSVLVQNYYTWLINKKHIAEMYSRGEDVTTLEEQTNQLEKELVRRSQSFSEFNNISQLTWQQVQASLQPGEAAIEFIHFGLNNYAVGSVPSSSDKVLYCAIIIRSESEYPEMIPLFYEHDLQALFGRFQMNNLKYINALYGTSNECNQALYNLVWKPLDAYLANINTVYYSPSGLLHKLSFSALSGETNVYLCDRYTLQMLGSTSQLTNITDDVPKTLQHISMFGGIQYDLFDSHEVVWEYLPATRNEIENIATIFNNDNISVSRFSDNIATETEFKQTAPKSDVLHIATHGFFYSDPQGDWKSGATDVQADTSVIAHRASRSGEAGFGLKAFVLNRNPLMRSGLVMAGANNVWLSDTQPDHDDGVLTALEVSHLDLRNTGLVVLSACETGLGDVKGSEGVYGLQRAFKMAGARYVIMSLWKVADKETEEFMTTFYSYLSDTADVKIAFSLTQQNMRQRYDPYYWAAFVLVW